MKFKEAIKERQKKKEKEKMNGERIGREGRIKGTKLKSELFKQLMFT